MDYHVVAQGKTTIPNVDDGEELILTDVRHRPIPLPLTHNLTLSLKFCFLFDNLLNENDQYVTHDHFSSNGTHKTNATLLTFFPNNKSIIVLTFSNKYYSIF